MALGIRLVLPVFSALLIAAAARKDEKKQPESRQSAPLTSTIRGSAISDLEDRSNGERIGQGGGDEDSRGQNSLVWWLFGASVCTSLSTTIFLYMCIQRQTRYFVSLMGSTGLRSSLDPTVRGSETGAEFASQDNDRLKAKLESHVEATDRMIAEANQRIDALSGQMHQMVPMADADSNSKSGAQPEVQTKITQSEPKQHSGKKDAEAVHVPDAEELGMRFLSAMKECDWKFRQGWDRFAATLEQPFEATEYWYDSQSGPNEPPRTAPGANWQNPVLCRLLHISPSTQQKMGYLFISQLCEYSPREQDFRYCEIITHGPTLGRDRLRRYRPPAFRWNDNRWSIFQTGEIVYQ